MLAITEISGADSIAATLQFASDSPEYDEMLPTYVSTGTEFGDFDGIIGNVDFLRSELRERHGVRLQALERTSDPALWRALNGRFASVLAERYGAWLPCVGCHLYLHVMRVPTAIATGSRVVISGERKHHGARVKANQTPEVLETYEAVLSHAGIKLALPIRGVREAAGVERILGERWPGGSPQLECVLSGNERGVDGTCGRAAPAVLLEGYLLPAGMAIVDEMVAGSGGSGGSDWNGLVAGVLGTAGAA